MKQCDNCRVREERVWQDSYTMMKLCGACLERVINDVTNSPRQEGDNLQEQLDIYNNVG